ncbi:MAG: stage III sporulation protein AG [Oscillospiraceae bacterium]|nr:stage III sporulation protein AG [Oscillospiraceae bacterium]
MNGGKGENTSLLVSVLGKLFNGLQSGGKKGNKWILWIGILGAGILLALGFVGESGDEVTTAAVGRTEFTAQQYEQALEQRLMQLLSQVEGAGTVSVMVTLESTEQTVYAQAWQESSDTTQTQQQNISQRSSYAAEYVLMDTGGDEAPLTETTLQPTVKGVAVVCTGAQDVGVVSRITGLISTVLGIPSNRICVTK